MELKDVGAEWPEKRLGLDHAGGPGGVCVLC